MCKGPFCDHLDHCTGARIVKKKKIRLFVRKNQIEASKISFAALRTTALYTTPSTVPSLVAFWPSTPLDLDLT